MGRLYIACTQAGVRVLAQEAGTVALVERFLAIGASTADAGIE